MKDYTNAKRIVVVLIVITVCMTASPIVMLSNEIRPFVLGLPFFLFWNILWPTVLFFLTIIYTMLASKEKTE